MSDKSFKDGVIAGVVGVPVILAGATLIFIPLAYARGWVLIRLWDWFIVPEFGLPHLRVAEAIGLSVLFTFMCPTVPEKENESSSTTATRAVVGLALPLLIGWVIHRYFM